MEKITENYNYVRNKFEKCLEELSFSFKLLEFDDDDDINYDISFEAPEPFKFVDTLQGIMYANIKENSITLIVINIYNIPKKKSITPFYRLVNDVNNTILHGKFSVREDIRQIIYTASVDCGDNFIDLSANKIKLLVNDYSENLMSLFIAIKSL